MKRFFYVFFIVLTLHSCSQSENSEPSEAKTNQLREDFQNLRASADKRDSEAILPWFSNSNQALREQACLVSGSIQDSILLPALYLSLKDSIQQVRKTAAWSIGQIANNSSCSSLQNHLQFEMHQDVRLECFKAFAKCLSLDSLDQYYREPFTGTDTEAWLKGIYQIILRQRDWKEQPDVIPFLAHPQEEVRLVVAHILSRSARELTENEASELELRMLNEASSNVRMAMVSALRKSKIESTANSLIGLVLDEDEHLGVRVNAIRALKQLNAPVPPGMILLLHAKKSIFAEEIAKWMIIYPATVDFALDRDTEDLSKRALAILMAEALKNKSRFVTEKSYLDMISESSELYEKMSFVQHLPMSEVSTQFLKQCLDSCKTPPLLTAFAEGISKWDWSRAEVQSIILKLAKTGDPGAVAFIAENILGNPVAPKDALLECLDSIRQELQLPREVETYNAIVNVLNSNSENEALELHHPEFNHPIDWSIIDDLSESIQVLVVTTKGEIVLELYPNLAPATVLDFIRLAKENYFDEKSFHRVVANFVIQGACPRGDGYGSLDYTLRSEFSPLPYPTGTLGMASAGKDTESCQWFITQSPTPHLEGRYTAFGRVTRGMDVVWAIQVGDRIREVKVLTP